MSLWVASSPIPSRFFIRCSSDVIYAKLMYIKILIILNFRSDEKTFGLFTYYHALFTYQGESDSFWSSPKLPSDFWEHQKIKNLNFKFSIISTFFIRSSNFDGFLMRSADVALIDGTQRQKTPSQSKMSIRILIFLKHFSCFFCLC